MALADAGEAEGGRFCCLCSRLIVWLIDNGEILSITDYWQCLYIKYYAIGCKHQFCKNQRRDVFPRTGGTLGVSEPYRIRRLAFAHPYTGSPRSPAVSAAAACLSCLSSFATLPPQ